MTATIHRSEHESKPPAIAETTTIAEYKPDQIVVTDVSQTARRYGPEQNREAAATREAMTETTH